MKDNDLPTPSKPKRAASISAELTHTTCVIPNLLVGEDGSWQDDGLQREA